MKISNRRLKMIENEKDVKFQLLEKKCEWLQRKLDKKLAIMKVEIIVMKLKVSEMDKPSRPTLVLTVGRLGSRQRSTNSRDLWSSQVGRIFTPRGRGEIGRNFWSWAISCFFIFIFRVMINLLQVCSFL